jgi:hypothetical protein
MSVLSSGQPTQLVLTKFIYAASPQARRIRKLTRWLWVRKNTYLLKNTSRQRD